LSVNARRRLSEAISEGEAISTLVRVMTAAEAAAAQVSGADGVLAAGSVGAIRGATALPILVAGATPEEASAEGADAWLLVAETGEDDLEPRHARAQGLGLECVVDVRDEAELETVLGLIDPEIVLLSPRAADDEDALHRVLELLPDVPAGKLVLAELPSVTHDELLALERAGVDAVLVEVRALLVAD
jgi:indole-3-glycerol phosphate synthase